MREKRDDCRVIHMYMYMLTQISRTCCYHDYLLVLTQRKTQQYNTQFPFIYLYMKMRVRDMVGD